MPRVIKDNAIVADDWQVLDADTPLPDGPVLVPLSRWQKERDQLSARGDCGVWLEGTDEPDELADDLDQLPLIAIRFPEFKDGRGYSIARILRDRLNYTGELRAIGDVLRDQLFYLKRCGFNSFALRADRDPEAALASLNDFRETYQAATDNPVPLFRRRSG